MKNKRGLELDMLGWVLIGLAILVIILISLGILSGKGNAAVDFIKSLFSSK